MNRSAHWLFGLALLPLAACASSTPPAPAPAPAPPPLAAQDQSFLNTVVPGTTTDQQINQLAATKARSPRLKAFASSEVDADTSSLQQLQTIAQSKGATADGAAPQMMQDLLAKLNADKPAAFDRDYLRGETSIFQTANSAFQDEATNGQDADLKAFATSTLPSVQASLKTLQRMSGSGAATTPRASRRHSAS